MIRSPFLSRVKIVFHPVELASAVVGARINVTASVLFAPFAHSAILIVNTLQLPEEALRVKGGVFLKWSHTPIANADSYVWSLKEKIRRLERGSKRLPRSGQTPQTPESAEDDSSQTADVPYPITVSESPITGIGISRAGPRRHLTTAQTLLVDNSPDILEYSKFCLTLQRSHRQSFTR